MARLNDPMRGFSLIEAMIAVAVVAILAGIAYPSYQEYVRRARRSAAQSFILDVASRQQQHLVDLRSYAPDLVTLNLVATSDVAPYYDFATAPVAGPPPGFTVTATPKGTQVSDKCGTLTLNQAGAKGAQATSCW